MARSTSERLDKLKTIRDALEDALETGASDVVEYRIGDRMVKRQRSEVMAALNEIDAKIDALELAVNGRAANRLRLVHNR